jgi:hypothetical protein
MEILLTILAVLGCIAMMGAAMVVLPRVGRRLGRSPRVRRMVGRLRRQSMIDRVLSWVEQERPDLAGAAAPDGTVTILFTDVEDSTALTSGSAIAAGWSCSAPTTRSSATASASTAGTRSSRRATAS